MLPVSSGSHGGPSRNNLDQVLVGLLVRVLNGMEEGALTDHYHVRWYKGSDRN